MQYRDYFKDKKITVMGLGLLGRGVGDAEFLARSGADLIVTDLKTKKQLKSSLDRLKKFKNIKYVLGKHRLQDFRDRDMILKSAGVPLDSSYIKEAKKNKIPVEMSASLLAKLSGVKIIGVTGTRGKTTITHLIYQILKNSDVGRLKNIFLGGNIRGISTLSLLGKVKKGDIVVTELDSWQLQGFGDSKISPHIAVFTNLMRDHMNYYKGNMKKYFQDKSNIYKHQKTGDYLIAGKEISKKIQNTKDGPLLLQRTVLCVPKPLPKNWKLKILGEHNRQNAAFAAVAANAAGVPKKIIKQTIENFKGVPGRLELVKIVRGIKIYNDTTATTPNATIVALKALSKNKNIILIIGGADKGLDMAELIKEIPKYCKSVILLDGTGTRKMQKSKIKMQNDNVKIQNANSLKTAFNLAMKNANRNDIVLFSPAFASFEMFKNEYDRGEQFNSLVNSL
ncbi:MAG: UDP-N-acetylmuramoyl-L-alanine--D-glutamate ligase [Candidatus Paceibacteria bacterium]